jgi:serine/threonine-protein kinase RIO1
MVDRYRYNNNQTLQLQKVRRVWACKFYDDSTSCTYLSNTKYNQAANSSFKTNTASNKPRSSNSTPTAIAREIQMLSRLNNAEIDSPNPTIDKEQATAWIMGNIIQGNLGNTK